MLKVQCSCKNLKFLELSLCSILQVRGLYKGASSSFVGMAFESSLLFGIYSQVKQKLQVINCSQHIHYSGNDLTNLKIVMVLLEALSFFYGQ